MKQAETSQMAYFGWNLALEAVVGELYNPEKREVSDVRLIGLPSDGVGAVKDLRAKMALPACVGWKASQKTY
ncbi:hypothetical protein AAC387_Pa04g1037 [Persea americana]